MTLDPLEQFVLQHRPAFDDEAPGPGLWSRINSELPDEDSTGLETFVQTHRAVFDDEAPDPALWQRISSDLAVQAPGKTIDHPANSPLTIRQRRHWAIAATLALLLTTSFLLGRYGGYQAGKVDYLAVLQEVQPDWIETQAYYEAAIRDRFELVTSRQNDLQLEADLDDIDLAMEEIKNELLSVPVEERTKLVAQLIQSYQLKLHILERILSKLPETPSAPAKSRVYESYNDI